MNTNESIFPAAMPAFAHADQLVAVLDHLGGDPDELLGSLFARGWDIEVERAAVEALDEGRLDPSTIRCLVIAEVRATLERTGRIDNLDRALLLIAELRLPDDDGAITPATDVRELTEQHACAGAVKDLAEYAVTGDVGGCMRMLRETVRQLACKAVGPNAQENADQYVRELAQALIARFAGWGLEGAGDA